MTAPRWLNDDEMRAWLAYRRMRLLLSAEINRDLAREAGLSEADYDVLSNLTATPDTDRRRLSELAARMQWSKSRLSHHITRMYSADWYVAKKWTATHGARSWR